MVGRIVSGDYRFSFNGQEEEAEIAKGILMAEYWAYDTRTGESVQIDDGAQHAMGYTKHKVHTVQKIQVITSTTTIDKDGNVISNSAYQKQYTGEYFDIVTKKPAGKFVSARKDDSDPDKSECARAGE